MKFAYQSSFIVGVPPPSFPVGTTLRWRPFVPIAIFNPNQMVSRRFSRALLDTGADQTIFPQSVFSALGLQPLASAGQTMIWRGRSYPVTYARVRLCLSDASDAWSWEATVGFSAAPLPYVVLGQNGVLEYLDVLFSSDQRLATLAKNSNFPP